MKIKLVKQLDKKGCAAACIAMVTGKSYEEVDKDFYNNFEDSGITTEKIIKYLAFAGFNVISKKVEYFNNIKFGRKEMLKPFADVHILSVCQFFDAEDRHVVVMDSKGKIFCPGGASEQQIKDCYSLEEIIGVYK